LALRASCHFVDRALHSLLVHHSTSECQLLTSEQLPAV
jgi:hypothetical protein